MAFLLRCKMPPQVARAIAALLAHLAFDWRAALTATKTSSQVTKAHHDARPAADFPCLRRKRPITYACRLSTGAHLGIGQAMQEIHDSRSSACIKVDTRRSHSKALPGK